MSHHRRCCCRPSRDYCGNFDYYDGFGGGCGSSIWIWILLLCCFCGGGGRFCR
ncbi:hypothetical protein [Clostridium fermenticellae]|uniref:hypothetical protein n=1 Tax=Clostridium fermenticellae TaxID=2068654 RepID=UPI0013C3F717|nr:hypothetical protein [Clostridium fermenticellae]